VAWTKVRPPQSRIGAVDPAEVDALAKASDLWATYATEIDRPSARELLAQKMGVDPPATTAAAPAPTQPRERAKPKPKAKAKDDGNPIVDFLKSREGRATVNTVVRGVFGMMKKGR
jgi:hypothetical protein